jgi:DNA-binding MarR family transcriptional regulator
MHDARVLPERAEGKPRRSSQDAVTDAVIGASRALVGMAVRSLSSTSTEVTMVQHRALVVLAYQGDQRVADLADNLGVNSSTVTRLVTRLVRKRFVERLADPDDGRATVLALTAKGREIVGAVREDRRVEIAKVLRRMPTQASPEVIDWLEQFTHAAGENAEFAWSLDWTNR